jgi:hypothetical protein
MGGGRSRFAGRRHVLGNSTVAVHRQAASGAAGKNREPEMKQLLGHSANEQQ